MRRAAIVAALWLGAIAPAGAGLCGVGASAVPCPSWPGDPLVRVHRGHRVFPEFVRTPQGVGIALCWGRQRIVIHGEIWCDPQAR